MLATTLPFLTLLDPVTTGEGVLDPLGLSTIGDRLADRILPGLRARMSRPRFVTAIAVAAAVCEGLEERVAADNVTPSYLVFEWLVVEAFIRTGDRDKTKGTPGILKAQAARASGVPLCAKTYLRAPSVFGFHGIYKPLAKHLGIVDDDLRLSDNGYELLKKWQTERNLDGFLDSCVQNGNGKTFRQLVRSAVDDGLKTGANQRSGAWQGWRLLAEHLVPSEIGAGESGYLHQLLHDAQGGTRGEVFRLIQLVPTGAELDESTVVREILLPNASSGLRPRLQAILDYEGVCGLLEDAFDWVRYLSTRAGARAITPTEYAKELDTHRITSALPDAVIRAESSLASAALATQQEYAVLAKPFDRVKRPEELFEAVLARHGDVQKAKKPDGKREWFEKADLGATFVRVPYRCVEPPAEREEWNRPYRINTVRSFTADLAERAYVAT